MSDPIGAAVSRLSSSVGSVNPALGSALGGLTGGQGTAGVGDKFLEQLGAALNGAAPKTDTQGTDNGWRQVPMLPPAAPGGGSFGDTLTKAINGVSDQQQTAADTLNAFLRGDNIELHQVMAATEEAQISLQMLIEVRNKFTEAYRSITTMQG
jgi:flagellar hook-basal body complex protein FliE